MQLNYVYLKKVIRTADITVLLLNPAIRNNLQFYHMIFFRVHQSPLGEVANRQPRSIQTSITYESSNKLNDSVEEIN